MTVKPQVESTLASWANGTSCADGTSADGTSAGEVANEQVSDLAACVDIQIAAESDQLPTAQALAVWANEALTVAADNRWSRLPAASVELCIRLVETEEGTSLNETYRGRSKPTNVLSFGIDEALTRIELGCPQPIGDIVLCVPVVEREAAQQGKPCTDHYAHLVVHGILHLLGFDHEEEVAAQDMECKEVAILRQLGIANPYE